MSYEKVLKNCDPEGVFFAVTLSARVGAVACLENTVGVHNLPRLKELWTSVKDISTATLDLIDEAMEDEDAD
jgi:hypothetical protein